VIVADTSAWVEYFRRTGSSVDRRLTELLTTRPDDVAVTEIVVGEMLAGATGKETLSLRASLLSFQVLPLLGMRDFLLAAALLRRCRDRGEPVRRLADCLVAVPALRAGATLLHADRDFERLARHTPLRLEPLYER
jgi:predicted nucleic acid-binding protein